MFAKKEKEDKKRRKNRGKPTIQDEDIPEIAERMGKALITQQCFLFRLDSSMVLFSSSS